VTSGDALWTAVVGGIGACVGAGIGNGVVTGNARTRAKSVGKADAKVQGLLYRLLNTAESTVSIQSVASLWFDDRGVGGNLKKQIDTQLEAIFPRDCHELKNLWGYSSDVSALLWGLLSRKDADETNRQAIVTLMRRITDITIQMQPIVERSKNGLPWADMKRGMTLGRLHRELAKEWTVMLNSFEESKRKRHIDWMLGDLTETTQLDVSHRAYGAFREEVFAAAAKSGMNNEKWAEALQDAVHFVDDVPSMLSDDVVDPYALYEHMYRKFGRQLKLLPPTEFRKKYPDL
jgi:hypothetical protein